MSAMKVLVLGGSDLIGRAVVTELVNHRYEIMAFSRSDPAADSLRQIGANVLSGDFYAAPRLGDGCHSG